MAVARRDLFDVLDAALAGEKTGHEIGDLLHALGFTAGGKQDLAEGEVGDGFGEAEAQLGVVLGGGIEGVVGGEGLEGVVAFDGALVNFGRDGRGAFVVEEFDGAAQKRALVVEEHDFEAAAAARDDVHAAVGVAAHDAIDGGGAAGVDDAFFIGEDDAEFEALADDFADHFFIAVFEDMEGEFGSGEENELERKQGQEALLHVTIMAFMRGCGLETRVSVPRVGTGDAVRRRGWCAKGGRTRAIAGAARVMILKLKRTPGIYLAGFMASGKTTVGRALADELGWVFVDLDEEIEKRAERRIAEIFEGEGEAAFRAMETAALHERVKSVQMGRPQVVALGGGTFLSEENFELVSNNGVSVWLDCAFAHVHRRVSYATHRPLARDPEKLKALYEVRREGYARADYRVEVDDDTVQAVARILALPLFKP